MIFERNGKLTHRSGPGNWPLPAHAGIAERQIESRGTPPLG